MRVRPRTVPLGLLLLALVVFVRPALSFGQDNLAEINANDEFRWGVMSLNRGHANEAIASLTRSISFSPERDLTRYWLGRAYYYSGFEAAALQEWEWVASHSGRTSILDRWIERIQLSRGLTEERLGDDIAPGRYVSMTALDAVEGELTLFRRPTMVRPRDDGFFYVVSFATHRVALFDPNGKRQQEILGNLEGFDRPFDVLPLDDGGILVTEFGADRIAVVNRDGIKTGSFGERGVGSGQLLGPQYIAADDSGYVYVTDYGNSRVAKFTLSGDFVFSFGQRQGGFRGFDEPAGIVVENGRVYVADRGRSRIYVFDDSGNYLGDLTAPYMETPEGLSLYSPGRLLVADGHRIYVIDVQTEAVYLLNDLNERVDLIGAVVDANGNLLATDHANEQVLFMTASEELYTGLNVELDRIDGAGHPTVYLGVTVTDRNGRPMLGLGADNFRVTEDRRPVGAVTLEYRGLADEAAAIAVVTDRSRDMTDDMETVGEVTLQIAQSVQMGDQLWLVGSGDQPLVEAAPGDGPLEFSAAARATAESYGPSRMDLAIRLAGAEVLNEFSRRSVIVVTNGVLSPTDFENYGLPETANYLANNRISLSVIYTRPNATNEELDYLVEASGGETGYAYGLRGVAAMVDTIRGRPSGRYLLRYQSIHPVDFGRSYIPVEIEAYLLERSGRDEAGFFGQLEF